MLLLKPCNDVAENETASSRFPKTAIRKIFQNFCTKVYGGVALGLMACNSTSKSNKFTKMFGTNKKPEIACLFYYIFRISSNKGPCRLFGFEVLHCGAFLEVVLISEMHLFQERRVFNKTSKFVIVSFQITTNN